MSVSKVKKKGITRCNRYQISELEKAFHINPKTTVSNLQPLVRRLDVNFEVAKTWFYKWQLQCGMKMDESEQSTHDIN